jgi:hypothetical protein
MSISLATKQKWFLKGAHAIGVAAPAHRGQGYCCPICLRISPSFDMFTVEHVPPQSVDGRPLILTCADCNCSAGGEMDWHWAHFMDVEGFAAGHLPEPVTVDFTYENVKIVAELSTTDGGFLIRGINKASNQRMIEELEKLLRRDIEASGRPQRMNVNLYKSKFSERLVRLSVLRAAFLTGVAVAGYRMIPLWDPIRRQILDPTEGDDSLSAIVRYERDRPRDRRELGVIDEPARITSIYVGLGRWAAFLPLAQDSLLYRPADLADQKFEYRGRAFHWPSEPSFGID